MEKIDRKPEKKGKTKTFLIDKELKKKDLRKTAERRASGSPPKTRIRHEQTPPRPHPEICCKSVVFSSLRRIKTSG